MKMEYLVLNEERHVSLTAYLQPVGGEFAGLSQRPAVLIIPGGGYQMTTAANGTDEVYFCNPGDVQRVSFGDGQLFAVGVDTLGLGAPADRLATYTKAIPGETYAFGPGNFSTLVDATTNKYATIVNGLLKGQAAAPTTAGTLYFELDEGLGIDTWTEANYGAFARYNLLCKRVISAT